MTIFKFLRTVEEKNIVINILLIEISDYEWPGICRI